MSLRRFITAIFALTLVAALLGAAVRPAIAQEEVEGAGPNFLSRLLGSVGLLQLPGPSVDTSERPPLVVPPMSNYVQPTMTPNQDLTPQARFEQNPWDFNAPRQEHLPPPPAFDNRPQQNVALPQPLDANTVRQRNPDFPIDPEIRAAQKMKKKKRTVANNYDDQWDRMRPDQLIAQGPKSRPERPGTNTFGDASTDRLRPDQLNVPNSGFLGMFRGKKEERLVFQGEPERQTLTQPPSGYLTPSANAPYGIVTADPKQAPRATGHANSPNNTDEMQPR